VVTLVAPPKRRPEGEVQTFHFSDGTTLCVNYDQDFNPRTEYDNAATMICFHRRYRLGDKHDYKSEDFGGWDELRERLEADFEPVFIAPLYLYDHGGLSISTGDFHDRWDSGPVGFVLVSKEKALEEWGDKNGEVTAHVREMAEKVAKGEVEDYDTHLRGENYHIAFYDADGKLKDCCGGILGRDHVPEAVNDVAGEEYAKVMEEKW